MNKTGPIVVIEDDQDDQKMLKDIFQMLNYDNEVIFFYNGISAYNYLKSYKKKPFIILSDINMPIMNGFELRDKIYEDEELRINCLPYIFLTTSISPMTIMQAYSKSVQGFFVKPNTYDEMHDLIKSIVEYWIRSESPYFYLG